MDWPKTLLASAFLLLFGGAGLTFIAGTSWLSLALIWSSVACSAASCVLFKRKRRREEQAARTRLERHVNVARMCQRIDDELRQAVMGYPVPPPEPETATAQLLYYEHQRRASYEDQLHAYAHDRHKAEQRSLELLKEKLSPQQREDFEVSGCFEVTGSKTGTRYRIVSQLANYNVLRLDKTGQPVEILCFEPTERLPKGDVLLTQKIYLENAEEEALAVANRYPG